MQKPLPRWAFDVLAIVGIVLVGSMLLPWVDMGGFEIRGIRLAWEGNHWLFLVPLAGAALVAAASTRSEHTRVAAIATGTVITGYTLLDVSSSMLHSGLDTWLILGGAGAMLAGVSPRNSAWRAVGGVAVLAGFFAPWTEHAMWDILTRDHGYLTMRMLWLVPVAGLAGIISAGNNVSGAKLAAGSGIVVFGAIVWAIMSVAFAVLGFGAWAALGGGTLALAVGVLARGSTPVVQRTAA